MTCNIRLAGQAPFLPLSGACPYEMRDIEARMPSRADAETKSPDSGW